jgi:hypothetical protein
MKTLVLTVNRGGTPVEIPVFDGSTGVLLADGIYETFDTLNASLLEGLDTSDLLAATYSDFSSAPNEYGNFAFEPNINVNEDRTITVSFTDYLSSSFKLDVFLNGAVLASVDVVHTAGEYIGFYSSGSFAYTVSMGASNFWAARVETTEPEASALLKRVLNSRIPGTSGSPGTPGRAAVPAVLKDVFVYHIEKWGPGNGPLETPQQRADFAAYTRSFNGRTEKRTVISHTQVLVPGLPAIAAVPAIPPTPAQVLTSINAGWNAGALSATTQSGDCTFTTTVSPSAIGVVAGLNSINEGSGYKEIDHGLYFSKGQAIVYEGGIAKSSAIPFTSATVFKVSRAGTVVRYYADTVLVYTSGSPSAGTVFVDASMYSSYDKVLSASFVFGSVGGGGSSAGIFPALRGLAGKSYMGGAGVLAPLASESGAWGHGFSQSKMPALVGLSSNRSYGGAITRLPALRSESGGGDLAPTFDHAMTLLPALQGAGRALTGEVGSSAGTFAALQGLSADRPYAQARTTLGALQSSGADLPEIDGSAFLFAPSPRLLAIGRDMTGANAAYLRAPSPTLAFFGGANASLKAPRATLAITGTFTNFGRASLSAPSATLEASGTVSGTGSFDPFLKAPSGLLVGYGGALASITLTGKASLQASGTAGSTGQAAITAPLFELVASGTAQNHGSANLLAPVARLGATAQAYLIAPAGRLEAIGTATVVATFEAYATNLLHAAREGMPTVDEVTRYTNFPFTHIVRYQGSYFGANSTGLYLLEGTTDDGASIAYNMQTHPDTMGSPALKTMVSAYMSGRIDPELTATVVAGEDNPQTYSYDSPRGATAQTHRVKFGRGVKDRYLAVGLSGNGALELDTIDLEISNLKRRI